MEILIKDHAVQTATAAVAVVAGTTEAVIKIVA
jgi:hypothetical protein